MDESKIEPGIRIAVKAFNEMGLKTLMSCEGHYAETGYMYDQSTREQTEFGGWKKEGLNPGNGPYITFTLDCEERLRDIVARSLAKQEDGTWNFQGFRLNLMKRTYPYGWTRDDTGNWVPAAEKANLVEQLILQICIDSPPMIAHFDRFILEMRDKMNV